MKRKVIIEKQKKSSIIKKILIIFLLTIVAFFILSSDIFSVETVFVENNTLFSQEEIIAMSGIVFGINTFKIKTKDISERIMDNPFIKNVKVSRILPDGINIEIDERKEAACVFFVDQSIVLDDEGYVLKTVESNPYLTIIDGLEIEGFIVGERIKIKKQEVLEEVLNVIMEMDRHDLFFKKISIENDQLKVAIYDKLFCNANSQVLMDNMKTLGDIIYDLHKKDIKRGIIRVESDGYFSYSPTD